MSLRHLVLTVLSLFLAVVGYFLFAIVVAIYTGIRLQGDKMYYAQGLWAHGFGAVGAAIGILFAWILWRIGLALLDRRNPR